MTRQAITLAQKIALCERRRTHPDAPNLALKTWFEKEFNRPISTSSVSDILGKRFAYLEKPSPSLRIDSSKRRRLETWPELEEALVLWVQRAELEVTITSDIIRYQAELFWKRLPMYKDLPPPQFSNGWLYKFQLRKGLKYREQHGETGSVPEDAEMQMAAIRALLRNYHDNDIYNCDETGLQWKRIPDRSISTRILPGRKKEKARITAHFCCNASATDRLPVWFIGTAKTPRCFTASHVNIATLGLYWRSNRKAWMVGPLFEEWLRWFDAEWQAARSSF